MANQPKSLKNPFVYGRILTANDAACPRGVLEERIVATVRDDGRLALHGDRRMGKSSAVGRTLQLRKIPLLRINFHEVMSLADAVLRTFDAIERFVQERSPIARRLAPWMRELGWEITQLRSSLPLGMEVTAAHVQTDHLLRAFGRIRDLAKKTEFAVFIDELQDIRDRLSTEVGNAALAIIRDEVQQMPKTPVFYAGSARDTFTLLFTVDASPFYEQARLVRIEPIPESDMMRFITQQFALGHGIDSSAAALILQVAGNSTNDIQRLCHETWNEHLAAKTPATAATVQRAFDMILRDISEYAERFLEELSAKQLRVVFAIAFLEHLGGASAEFLEFAGIRNPGDVPRALGSLLKGKEALLEKVGSRYCFRSRFARLWFALRYYRVQALIPAMRTEQQYRRYLTRVLPPLPLDALRPQP